MICERCREQIPECLAGRLDKNAREKVIEHMETCSACRAELAELGVVWRGLEALALPAEEPNAAMRDRFLESLHAYEAGLEAGKAAQLPVRKPVKADADKPRHAGFWPSRPVWQFATAAALLAAGALGGKYAATPRGENPEMAQLKGQVEGLRQLVALSLLQDQSAGSRMRGVTYSVQMAQPDSQVEQALLSAVTHDPNVNVRLSAVDALEKYAGDPQIRRALVDAVPLQDSPLVQVALIDLLVQLNDRDSGSALQKLAVDPQADEMVRQRAATAMQKLGLQKKEEISH
jgi:HEAT repeat protein/putative zinc finger protein